LPFPNQRVRRENIRFFIRNNVKGIFEQDTYNTPHSELAQLGGYITAKFLWNPDYDEDTAIREFLGAYYEQAADPIRSYLDLIHARVARENIHVDIWAEPDSPHLTDELLIQADGLWQRAEQAVADNPAVLERVKLSRMSVDYAIVERASRRAAGQRTTSAPLHALAAARLQPFLTTLRSSSLSRVREWNVLDKDQYSRQLTEAIGAKQP
jgi:hypothetical protein